MTEARKAFLWSSVVVGVVVGALALWHLRLLIFLLFPRPHTECCDAAGRGRPP
jgi:hypothetical protein